MRLRRTWPAVGLGLLVAAAAWGAGFHEPIEIELDLSDPSTFNVLSEPFSIERGEVLPDELLSGLAVRSFGHESALEGFTCTETVVQGGESADPLEYLLGVDEDRRFEIEEIRFNGEQRSGRRSGAVPPPGAWATLFSDLNRPYFVYRYLGIRVRGYAPVHAVLFRGSLWFEGGADIREWEGVAYMDPVTFDPLFVEAAPRLHAERAKSQAQKHKRSLKLSFAVLPEFAIAGVPISSMKTRRQPSVTAVTVDFSRTALDRALPAEMTLRRYKFSGTEVREKIVEVRRYANYRFFDTRTDERLGAIR